MKCNKLDQAFEDVMSVIVKHFGVSAATVEGATLLEISAKGIDNTFTVLAAITGSLVGNVLVQEGVDKAHDVFMTFGDSVRRFMEAHSVMTQEALKK